jgi:nitrogen fixation protein FixH
VNIVKSDPVAAGKLGAAAKERNALARIGEAREALGVAAPRVARQAVRAALGQDSISPVQATMVNSVLDRTVGKAPTELRIGMADQTMQVLDMLELED